MTNVADIVQRLDEIEKRFAKAERERDEYRALYLATMERCRKLELGILLCGVEPSAYVRDVFCLLPTWPEHRLLELAPLNWKKSRDAEDVRNALAANRFRQLTLDARG